MMMLQLQNVNHSIMYHVMVLAILDTLWISTHWIKGSVGHQNPKRSTFRNYIYRFENRRYAHFFTNSIRLEHPCNGWKALAALNLARLLNHARRHGTENTKRRATLM